MRLALCQINATVGDIDGNAERIRAGIRAAEAADAELVLFPELALTGYPPEDLLLKEHFLADAAAALQELAADVREVVAIVGYPERAEDVYNAAAILAGGSVHAIYRKLYLPNYGVFDERRYFQAGACGAVIDIPLRGRCGAQRIGFTVCEDIWKPGPPASDEALAGATLIVNISASPYHAGKGAQRERMLVQRAREHLACIAFCGLVGGQDELVFDGHSCVIDHTGQTLARAAQFQEETLVCDIDVQAAAAARLRDPSQRPAARRSASHAVVLPALPALPTVAGQAPLTGARLAEPLAPVEAEVYCALALGLRDYVRKNGFEHVVLGLSGGIDSALVACLAADALGAGRVSAAIMPSPFSSDSTQGDARALADALGLRTHELIIESVMHAYEAVLEREFAERERDLTEENLQARIRGNLLMALSNKFGWLVLTTGNKSEMSVGYTTLYGDLAGGFAVIKDVPKTLVYRLCAWRNSPAAASATHILDRNAGAGVDDAREAAAPNASPIPDSILARAPSAELRHDQRDEDSLPPYELLDRILEGYVELDRSREQLIADGLPASRGGPHDPPGRPRRVQAPPSAAGDQDQPARVRARPAYADHQSLLRLSAGDGRGPSSQGALPCPRAPSRPRQAGCRPRARRALRAGAGRLRQHAAEPADPAQHARGPDRRAVSRVLAGWLLSRPGAQRSHARSERLVQHQLRQLRAGRRGRLHLAAAGGDLARQQLRAWRRGAGAPPDASGVSPRRSPRQAGRSRSRPRASSSTSTRWTRMWLKLPRGHSCRSTQRARPKRRCPPRCANTGFGEALPLPAPRQMPPAARAALGSSARRSSCA